MCGIVGIYSFKENIDKYSKLLDQAISSLKQRGPDSAGSFIGGSVAMGHSRLSIIDTSEAGSQPMKDTTGRYVITFNGEIYNYKQLRTELEKNYVKFRSNTDTEVLLNLFILEGPDCLQKVNGFFAFAIYDTEEKKLFIARDRIGIKPLLVYQDEEKLVFGSEMKALIPFNPDKELDYTSLYFYLQLNYIPAPSSIFKKVKKLEPGHYLIVNADGEVDKQRYYRIPYSPASDGQCSFASAKKQLEKLLDDSVQKRLVSDVPLGAFLSGGIDSSVIVALASRHVDRLNTFSIGFEDEPMFDETAYANLVAKKFNTNHTVFKLNTRDLYDSLFDILEYIDEPFADSSAIAVYILSKQTRTKVKVALSGDGADELFGGYNKHLAEYRAQQENAANTLMRVGLPLFEKLPKSRNSTIGNKLRQLHRYAEGLNYSSRERYWRWCSFINEKEAFQAVTKTYRNDAALKEYSEHKDAILGGFNGKASLNDTFYTDMHLVLQNDMLTKVDLMSMANSLEVRVPFLDHELVNFMFTLPSDYKVYKGFRKKILKDTFRKILPPELYNRPKQGFEVPLLRWFRGELRGLIEDDLLSPEFIKEQGTFELNYIEGLKKKLSSNNPGEVQAQIWGLVVFQYWWKKYLA